MLLPLVTDQLSGQLDDHSTKPDYEACVQLLSTALDNLDRKDVVRQLPVHLQITVGHRSYVVRKEAVDIYAAKICFIYRAHVKSSGIHGDNKVKLLLFTITRSQLG